MFFFLDLFSICFMTSANLFLTLSLHSPILDPKHCHLCFSTVFIPLSSPQLCFSFRFAMNVDEKEVKEWKDGKEWKEANKDGKEAESSRPLSVISSLSYRKRPNPESKGDDLFVALKKNAESDMSLSFQKGKPKTSDFKNDSFSTSSRHKSYAGDDAESVVSLAYSEASSRARKGMDSRWADFDNESTVSYAATSRASMCLGLSPNDAKSIHSRGLPSSFARRQSTSRLDEGRGGRSLYGSSPSSPCFSRRSGGRSPGSVSQADSHMSLARSCRLSEFDLDLDDGRSVAFTERSAYSPHSSTGRSVSMPPPRARSSLGEGDPTQTDTSDIKTVSHRNYLDPDLEKAINEVLNFKPIKFKRRSLEDDSDGKEEDQAKKDNGGDGSRPTSSLRRSASAVDCIKVTQSSSRCSSRSRSKSKGKKGKKKKRSQSSESDSSGNEGRRRNSSRRSSKKFKKKSQKRRESSSSSSSSSSTSSSSSESDSDSGSSSSGASTISYRSSSSIKRAPAKKVPSIEDGGAGAPSESQPANKKEDKKRKKKVDSLMMKYLYRPDSD